MTDTGTRDRQICGAGMGEGVFEKTETDRQRAVQRDRHKDKKVETELQTQRQ